MPRRNRPPVPKLTPQEIANRDDVEQAEVEAVAAELPADHPIHAAIAAGRNTAGLSYLVVDHPELLERLKAALYAGNKRSAARTITPARQ